MVSQYAFLVNSDACSGCKTSHDCLNPVCIPCCPTEAISKTETGIGTAMSTRSTGDLV